MLLFCLFFFSLSLYHFFSRIIKWLPIFFKNIFYKIRASAVEIHHHHHHWIQYIIHHHHNQKFDSKSIPIFFFGLHDERQFVLRGRFIHHHHFTWNKIVFVCVLFVVKKKRKRIVVQILNCKVHHHHHQ